MQNKNPILVLTGAAIVAAAAVAGITRDKWMGPETPAVTAQQTTQATEQPATPEAPASTQETTTAAAQPEQPAATAQETTTAAAQPEQPAATTQETTVAPAEQPASNAAAEPEVPTFDTVNIQKTGEAVIAGRAEPGADVVVKLDGKEIGKTTANADGAFVVVPEQPLPAGSGALTIEAKGTDETVAVGSEQSVAVIVPAGQPEKSIVAVVSPDAPTKILQKPEPQAEPDASPKPAKLVSIDSVDYDTKGNIVFAGQGDEGNTARIYVDNTMLGDAPVGADGNWTFSGTAEIAPGNHSLRVDGLDADGKVVNRVEVPFFREEQSKVADAAPAETTATQTESATAATTTDEQAASQPAAEAAQAETAASATQETAATPAKPKEGRVVIQPGNNLWRISRVLYGSGAKYTMLFEANKDLIRNPDRIYPGQVFKTPSVAAKSEAIDPKRRDPLKPEENGGAAQ